MILFPQLSESALAFHQQSLFLKKKKAKITVNKINILPNGR